MTPVSGTQITVPVKSHIYTGLVRSSRALRGLSRQGQPRFKPVRACPWLPIARSNGPCPWLPFQIPSREAGPRAGFVRVTMGHHGDRSDPGARPEKIS